MLHLPMRLGCIGGSHWPTVEAVHVGVTVCHDLGAADVVHLGARVQYRLLADDTVCFKTSGDLHLLDLFDGTGVLRGAGVLHDDRNIGTTSSGCEEFGRISTWGELMRRTPPRSLIIAATSAVLLVPALGACGSSGSSGGSAARSSGSGGSSSQSSGPAQSDKSSTQVLKEAKSALFNAKSVHATGTMTEQGQQEKIDMWFVGRNTAGTQSVNGVVVHIVKIGDTAYIKAPASFWTKTAGSQGAALGDKWIKSTGKTSNLSGLTLQALAASIDTGDSPLRKGVKHETLKGKKVLVLTQQDGSTMYVADAKPPVPLRLVNAGKSKGSLNFTDYGASHDIAAPKGAVTAKQAVAHAKPTEA